MSSCIPPLLSPAVAGTHARAFSTFASATTCSWVVDKQLCPRSALLSAQNPTKIVFSPPQYDAMTVSAADLETFSVLEAVHAGSQHDSGHRKHPVSENTSENAAEELGQLVLISDALLLSWRDSFGMGTLQQDVTERCRSSGQPQTLLTLSSQHICPFGVALGEAGA